MQTIIRRAVRSRLWLTPPELRAERTRFRRWAGGLSARRFAIQDDLSLLYGTTITWSDTTGTKAITLNGLASGSAQQGVKSATLVAAPSGLTTAVLPDLLEIEFVVQFNAAVTAGGQVGLYLGFSDSPTAGTNNPGGLTGANAAYSAIDALPQLTFAGGLTASATLGAAPANQQVDLTVRPQQAYFSPVVYNNSSAALKASNDVSVIRVTPGYLVRST